MGTWTCLTIVERPPVLYSFGLSIGSTMRFSLVVLVMTVAVVQATIQRGYKIRGQRIKTGNDDMAKDAAICKKKCAKYSGDDACVAWNWRPNNKRFPYKLRRRCILLKKVTGSAFKIKGWFTGTV